MGQVETSTRLGRQESLTQARLSSTCENKDGRFLHFCARIDFCHSKQSELEKQFQTCKGRVVLQGDIRCKNGMTASGHVANTHGLTGYQPNLTNGHSMVAWAEGKNPHGLQLGYGPISSIPPCRSTRNLCYSCTSYRHLASGNAGRNGCPRKSLVQLLSWLRSANALKVAQHFQHGIKILHGRGPNKCYTGEQTSYQRQGIDVSGTVEVQVLSWKPAHIKRALWLPWLKDHLRATAWRALMPI